ncbi:MAG: trigger factor, partial [Solirubrobacteraceae bacterium]
LKELPELDDDFAADVGFDTIAELRGDITERLREVEEQRVQSEFRDNALDAAVEQAEVDVPDALIQARAKEMWERMLHSLSHRGVSREAYLQISGRDEEQLLAELIPDAERALRREAVLTAVVAAEAIEPTEEDLLDAVGPSAEREEVEPSKLLDDLRASGRLEDLREDLAARQAIELIAEAATPISVEQAQAREKLWTPEKEAPQGADGGLWTPES